MVWDLGAYFLTGHPGLNFFLTQVDIHYSQICSLLYLWSFRVVSQSLILRVDQYASSFLNGQHVFTEVLFLLKLSVGLVTILQEIDFFARLKFCT